MIYIFDTNAVTDMMREHPRMIIQVRKHQQEHILCLCQPVDFEVQRGLKWKDASRQINHYLDRIKSQFEWLSLTDADWQQAAQFWADARSAGKQLSDIDLLLAAIAHRLDAIIVSNDNDFDVLPVQRENWRE